MAVKRKVTMFRRATGCILKLRAFVPAKIDTHNAHFRIEKIDGSKFTTTGTVSLRRNSSNGPVVLSAPIYAGAYDHNFYFNLNDQSNFGSKPVGSYIDYYGRVESNSGVAYVGKIRVTKGTYP